MALIIINKHMTSIRRAGFKTHHKLDLLSWLSERGLDVAVEVGVVEEGNVPMLDSVVSILIPPPGKSKVLV